jgi:hypothetical protein
MRNLVVHTRVWSVALGALFCIVAEGCGSGEKIPPLVTVTGKVTYNGKPLVGATVAFVLDSNPAAVSKKSRKDDPAPVIRPILGETDDQGNYELSFGEHTGVPVGKYQVGITAYEPMAEGGDTEDARPNRIPTKFGVPKTSGMTAVVTEDGDNEFNFNLTDDGVVGGAAPAAGPRDE